MSVKKQSYTWFMLGLKYSTKIIILIKDVSRTMLFLWQWLQKKISEKKTKNRWMLVLYSRVFDHLLWGFVN